MAASVLDDFFTHKALWWFRFILDTDENGVLTKEDFVRAAMKYAIIHCKGDKVDSVWDGYQEIYDGIWTALRSQADENADEMVEFEEWKSLMDKLAETSKSFEDLPKYLQDLALRLFSSFDINNDLGIDEGEYTLFLGSRNMELKKAKECFQYMAGDVKKIKRPLFKQLFHDFLTSKNKESKGKYICGPFDSPSKRDFLERYHKITQGQ